MSRGKIFGGVVAVLMIGGGTVSAWTLRAPIKHGLELAVSRNQSDATVRFAVIGDNHGVNAVYQQAIKDIAAEPVDFLLNLADTSEFGTRQEFAAVRNLEKGLPFPVYHTIGNHDIKTDPMGGLFTDVFGHAPNQTIDRGRTHIVILDNANRNIGFSETTLNWLEDDLRKNRDKTILLAYHRPFDLPLAAVIGDDETAASRVSNERFLELISHNEIAYILTAHLHTYLQYSVAGVPAVISGGGGDPAQAILGGPAANYFHYLVVTVKGKQVTTELRRVQL